MIQTVVTYAIVILAGVWLVRSLLLPSGLRYRFHGARGERVLDAPAGPNPCANCSGCDYLRAKRPEPPGEEQIPGSAAHASTGRAPIRMAKRLGRTDAED